MPLGLAWPIPQFMFGNGARAPKKDHLLPRGQGFPRCPPARLMVGEMEMSFRAVQSARIEGAI